MHKGSKMKRGKSKGFTLIELLVVVAIIGILAAIAIPQFAAYRARGFHARAASDARNAATAQEASFVDNNVYFSGACTGLPGFTGSGKITCTTQANGNAFTVTATYATDGYTCTWSSAPAPGASNMVCA